MQLTQDSLFETAFIRFVILNSEILNIHHRFTHKISYNGVFFFLKSPTKFLNACTTDYGRPMNFKLLSLGRQFGHINFGAFGVFSAELSAPILVMWVPCLCFFLSINNYFCKKTKPLYPHPKYLVGIGIWIWATKN